MVEVLSPQQLAERRAELLARFGGSEDQLRERAQEFSLSPEELAIWDELEAVDYLLA